MPALASPATWRTHPQRFRLHAYILNPDVVVSRRVNASTFAYPVTYLIYDNPDAGGGDPTTDVNIGMTVRIKDGTTQAFKGWGRITQTPSTTQFFIAPISSGIINFADNDIIEVLDDYRLSTRIPLTLPDGTLYMDWNNRYGTDAAHMLPKANAGPWYAAEVNSVTSLITVSFDASESYAMANGATLSSRVWDVGDGTITVGTSTSEQITATFPAGYRWVSLTVTDSNGQAHTMYTLVVATDGDALAVEAMQLAGDVENGWGCSLRLLETDTSSYPEGAALIVWADEVYGTTAGSLNGYSGREHVKFCGWLVSDRTMMETRLDTFLDDWDIVAEGVLGILEKQAAFSMTLQQNASPATWFDVAGLDWWRITHHFMLWHSTLTAVCDIEKPAHSASYSLYQFDSDPGSPKEQFGILAEASGARLTVDARNRVYFRRNPHLMNTGERAAVATIIALADTDWTERLEVNRRHTDEIGAITAYAIIASSTEIAAVKAASPGTAPGQGARLETLNRQIVQSQTELNDRVGKLFAQRNLKDRDLPISILNGGLIADPAWGEWITFTTTAPNRRGLAYSAAKYVLRSVSVSYDHRTASCQEQWDLERTLDTEPVDAITIQMPGADPPADNTEDYVPSDGTYSEQTPLPYEQYIAPEYVPDVVSTAPVTGDTNMVAAGDDLHIGGELGAALPTWAVNHDLTLNERVVDVVHSSASDLSISDLRLWDLSYNPDTNDSKLYYNSDVLGVGSWTAKQTITNKIARLLRHVAGEASGQGVAFTALAAGGSTSIGPYNLDAGLPANMQQTDHVDYAGIIFSPWVDGGFGPREGFWVAAGGRTNNLGCLQSEQVSNTDNGFGQYEKTALVVVDLGQVVQVTDISLYGRWNSASKQVGSWNLSAHFYDANKNQVASGVFGSVSHLSSPSGTSWNQATESGIWDGVRYILVGIFNSVLIGDISSFWAYCDDIQINYNLYDDRDIVHSSDTGDTINTVSVGNSAATSSFAPFDADDFNLGVFICSDGLNIDYTTAYTDASSTELTGLAGIDGSAEVTCISVPYRKILTQQLNNDANAIQFIYGVNAAVSGATTWAVSFDTATGTIHNEQDITPIISGTTYWPINEHALKTAGGNTQVMAMLGKPTGGGNTDLLITTDGGGSWSVVQSNVNYTYLFWVDGTDSQLFLAGGGDQDYSPDRGISLIDQTGDIVESPNIFLGFAT